MAAPNSAKAAVPFLYRLIILTIEPLCAIMGALLVIRDPATYADSVTRHSVAFSPDTAFVFTALGGSWLYFAFVELVVMRLVDDLFLWRVLCAGMLISDSVYLHSLAQGVGGWASYVVLANWTTEDYVGMALTAPMVLSRIMILSGIGLRTPTKEIQGAKTD